MYIKTRECIDSNLLSVQVYRWELVGDPQLDMSGDTRGPGGVAVLYKKELHDRVNVVHKPKDMDAHYM